MLISSENQEYFEVFGKWLEIFRGYPKNRGIAWNSKTQKSFK